eukprot:8365109-Pyramimonas_sp.AAC.1
MVCIACGGYAWAAAQSLSKPCASRPPTKHTRRQLARAWGGVFPSWGGPYKGWRLGPLSEPSAADLLALAAPRGLSGAMARSSRLPVQP